MRVRFGGSMRGMFGGSMRVRFGGSMRVRLGGSMRVRFGADLPASCLVPCQVKRVDAVRNRLQTSRLMALAVTPDRQLQSCLQGHLPQLHGARFGPSCVIASCRLAHAARMCMQCSSAHASQQLLTLAVLSSLFVSNNSDCRQAVVCAACDKSITSIY